MSGIIINFFCHKPAQKGQKQTKYIVNCGHVTAEHYNMAIKVSQLSSAKNAIIWLDGCVAIGTVEPSK